MKRDESIIAETPSEIGAHTAVSQIPDDYEGPCAVVDGSGSERIIAVLPSVHEAFRVARCAISIVGGYSSTVVVEADLPITHPDLESWV